MSGTNHVVGGTVFTGVFASFWNVNIFSSPILLFFTIFFAILPDVDHLKSPIGKLFYPLAKWLNIRFGHRTITHSLIFYIPLTLAVAITENVLRKDFSVTLICGFAYFSHLLFDMMTKSGIPLFWPKRNPCVIPGNPELRLKSSHFQTEAVCFAIFIVLGLSCQNLFSDGFWTTYNKQFNDLKHLAAEAKRHEKILSVKYDFSNQQGKRFSGEGILVASSPGKAVIFDSSFIVIDESKRVKVLDLEVTESEFKSEELIFYNVTEDSLFTIIKNRPILRLKLQASHPFDLLQDNELVHTTSASFDFVFNPTIVVSRDSVDRKKEEEIELLKNERARLQTEQNGFQAERRRLRDRITSLNRTIPKMDLYEREKAVKELSELQTRLDGLKDTRFDQLDRIRIRLHYLQPNLYASQVKFTGYIEYFSVSKP